jgi:hypothetical protein
MTAPADITHSGAGPGITSVLLAEDDPGRPGDPGEPGVAQVAVAGGGMRWLLIGAALAAGLVIALLTIHLVGAWDARLALH